MKIAIPIANGKLAMHFGHCETFVLFTVDENEKKILSEDYLTPPPHEPGVIPRWLSSEGANCIIAGGMGIKAKDIFEANNVRVITGGSADAPHKLVEDFLNNKLETGPNACDH